MLHFIHKPMTYNDNYTYEASHALDQELQAVMSAQTTEKPAAFIKLCHAALDAKKSGGMPPRDAAYVIARTMFIRELENDLFEAITSLAGQLELPDEFIDGDIHAKWDELAELIAEYSKNYQ